MLDSLGCVCITSWIWLVCFNCLDWLCDALAVSFVYIVSWIRLGRLGCVCCLDCYSCWTVMVLYCFDCLNWLCDARAVSFVYTVSWICLGRLGCVCVVLIAIVVEIS